MVASYDCVLGGDGRADLDPWQPADKVQLCSDICFGFGLDGLSLGLSLGLRRNKTQVVNVICVRADGGHPAGLWCAFSLASDIDPDSSRANRALLHSRV